MHIPPTSGYQELIRNCFARASNVLLAPLAGIAETVAPDFHPGAFNMPNVASKDLLPLFWAGLRMGRLSHDINDTLISRSER